jgi:hypothetical protein
MTNAQEKRINGIAERKGFRLDKVGHGKGHSRLAEGGRMRSGATSIPLRWRRPRRGLLRARNEAASREDMIAPATHAKSKNNP